MRVWQKPSIVDSYLCRLHRKMWGFPAALSPGFVLGAAVNVQQVIWLRYQAAQSTTTTNYGGFALQS